MNTSKLKDKIKKNKLVSDYLNSKKQKENADMLEELCNISKSLSDNGVFLYVVSAPEKTKIKNLSEFEKERIYNWVLDFNNVNEKDFEILKKIYGEDISKEYIESLYVGATVVDLGYRKIVADYKGENVNVFNGMRYTCDQPENYSARLFTLGPCISRGTGVEDKHTIASFLQNDINENSKDSFIVINASIGCGSDIADDINVIKSTAFTSGDIIVIFNAMGEFVSDYCVKNNIRHMYTSQLFDRPHKYNEWFTDETYHTNKYGNKVIADYVFSNLKADGTLKNEYLDCENKKTVRLGGEVNLGENNEAFEKYLDTLREYTDDTTAASNNGGIVMNCNPFTLGHRYLIETAAKQVDKLFIFVVEEDKSFFPYSDRMELVKKGTEDLGNVIVVPSGNFIISALTFPGYFNKDNLKEAVVDTSMDVNLFASKIAPVLNIKTRFAGEEPLDPVTNQYNQTMKMVLPQYNMKFCEIKRKKDDTNVISASRVRKYIKEKDWESIKKIVPATTYEYLQDKFGDKDE